MDDGRLPGITIQTRSQLHTMDDGRWTITRNYHTNTLSTPYDGRWTYRRRLRGVPRRTPPRPGPSVPSLHPCKIRHLPLDCHCNSGVNSRYRRGINGETPAYLQTQQAFGRPSAPARWKQLAAGGDARLEVCGDGGGASQCRGRAGLLGPLAQACPVCTPVRSAVYPWIATVTQG